MAKLERERSRKPIIENGSASPGTTWERESGTLYRLSVSTPWQEGKRGEEYIATLSKADALWTMQHWLEAMMREENDRIRKQHEEARRRATE